VEVSALPELPEVEMVRRTIAPHIAGRVVKATQVLWPGTLAQMTPELFDERLVGACFCTVVRRGKYLGLALENGAYLVIHLRMTGRLLARPLESAHESHLRVLLLLDDNTTLRFVDQRKFGRIYWEANMDEYMRIAHVGPEPLTDEFTTEVLATALAGSKMKVKARLLDQNRIAGLGNIYADESLFRAGIHPERLAGSLNEEEVTRLRQAIRTSLLCAIEHGGTTLRDYVNGDGRSGDNQNYLLVYGRAGSSCPNCAGTLERIKVAGRGTVFCPRCQK
jgi:formamidopyrimidine-DNA glycosylase